MTDSKRVPKIQAGGSDPGRRGDAARSISRVVFVLGAPRPISPSLSRDAGIGVDAR